MDKATCLNATLQAGLETSPPYDQAIETTRLVCLLAKTLCGECIPVGTPSAGKDNRSVATRGQLASDYIATLGMII